MLRMAEHRQKSGKLPHLIHDRARCPRAVQRSILLKYCHFHKQAGLMDTRGQAACLHFQAAPELQVFCSSTADLGTVHLTNRSPALARRNSRRQGRPARNHVAIAPQIDRRRAVNGAAYG